MDPLIFIFSLSNEMKNSLKKLLFQLLGIQLFWTFRSLYLAISDVKMMMIMDEKADLSVVYFSPPDPPMIFPNCRKRKKENPREQKHNSFDSQNQHLFYNKCTST